MNDNPAASGDVIRVTTTSGRTADITPIVLRETSTTRLIFRPVLLDNPHSAEATIDGCFVHQRKSPRTGWTDHSELSLSNLRAEEWIKIELKAAELLTLFRRLSDYYDLVEDHGLGRGTSEFVPAPQSRALRALLQNEATFHGALDNDEEVSSALLGGLVSWIASRESAVAAARLDGVSLEDLQQFDAVLGLARLQRFCRELDENSSNNEESYWQHSLERNGWVIAQVFAIPIMLIQSQVYVGGKRITNRGGNTADFLYENEVTGNVVLVEIKTPLTPLLGARYRNNIYPASDELSGGLAQVLNDRMSLTENYEGLATDEMRSRRPLSSRGLLIVGSAHDSLSDHDRRKSFELWRNNQREVDVVTFDELRKKVSLMVELLENAGKPEATPT